MLKEKLHLCVCYDNCGSTVCVLDTPEGENGSVGSDSAA